MSYALKPCPFCGQPPHARHTRANPWAACKTDGCWGAKLPIVSLDSPRDIEAWNTRADSKLATAEARADRLAGALEWIQRQDLDDLRMQLVVDAERDGQYYVCGDSNKPGYGPTLLDAVERAALAEGEGK